MVHVLLGYIGVVPEHFLLEMPCGGLVIQPANVRANDPFEGLKHRTRPNSVQGIGPRRPLAQVHGIVISVGKPESNRYPFGGLEAESIDQLFRSSPMAAALRMTTRCSCSRIIP